MEIILTYITMASPALASLVGVIILICQGLSQLKKASAEISSRDDIIKLISENAALRQAVVEQTRANKLLTDKIVKIQGYAERKTNEKKKED